MAADISLSDDVISLDDGFEDEWPDAPEYSQEFLKFIDDSVTVFHTVQLVKGELTSHGFKEVRENEFWPDILENSGKYFVSRNNSCIVAFAIGGQFDPSPVASEQHSDAHDGADPNASSRTNGGSAFAMIGSHIDSIHIRLKPHSIVSCPHQFERIGVGLYAGGGRSKSWDAQFSTWWDRDLGLGGKVLVKQGGRVVQRLFKSSHPVATIPSSGKEADKGPFNYETNMLPIFGLVQDGVPTTESSTYLSEHHSARLLNYVAQQLSVEVSDIVDFDLRLYDTQPSTLLGIDTPDFISAPRMDDKLCSFSGLKALIEASSSRSDGQPSFLTSSKDVLLLGLFDNEEVGSSLPYGAKGGLMESVAQRVTETFAYKHKKISSRRLHIQNIIAHTLARSFLVSADVSNGLNPDFIDNEIYAEHMVGRFNKGMVVSTDPGQDMTTDMEGLELARRISPDIQLFQNRCDAGGGGTIGPGLSERLGCRAMDVGMPMLSMHSIRGLTGSKEPLIGVEFFRGFYTRYESLRGEVLRI